MSRRGGMWWEKIRGQVRRIGHSRAQELQRAGVRRASRGSYVESRVQGELRGTVGFVRACPTRMRLCLTADGGGRARSSKEHAGHGCQRLRGNNTSRWRAMAVGLFRCCVGQHGVQASAEVGR